MGTLGALVLAVILVMALARGPARPERRVTSPGPGTSTARAGGTTGGVPTAATAGPQILAQLNLESTTGARSPIGIAQVIRERGVVGVVIDAQDVPPNNAHDAYALWLYNSARSARLLGFVRYLVGRDGRLSAEGRLPRDASSYHRLLITLETHQHPTVPGEVVLAGPFREHP